MQTPPPGPGVHTANWLEQVWTSVTTHSSEFWAWAFVLIVAFGAFEGIRTAFSNATTMWRLLYGVLTAPVRVRKLEERVALLERKASVPVLAPLVAPVTIEDREPERPSVQVGLVRWAKSAIGRENEPCCAQCYSHNGQLNALHTYRQENSMVVYCNAPYHGKQNYLGSVDVSQWQAGLGYKFS